MIRRVSRESSATRIEECLFDVSERVRCRRAACWVERPPVSTLRRWRKVCRSSSSAGAVIPLPLSKFGAEHSLCYGGGFGRFRPARAAPPGGRGAPPGPGHGKQKRGDAPPACPH